MELRNLSGIAPEDEPDIFETEGVVSPKMQYAIAQNDTSINVIDVSFEEAYKKFREKAHLGFFNELRSEFLCSNRDDKLDITSLLEQYKYVVNECRRLEKLISNEQITVDKGLDNVYGILSDILKSNFRKSECILTDDSPNRLQGFEERALLNKFKVLEDRITFLERIVGIQDGILEEISAGVTDKSVMGILNSYKSKIDALTPSIITDAGNRLVRFVQSMSEPTNDQVFKALENNKMQKLSEIIENSIIAVDLIPHLLSRFDSLSLLHSRALNFSENVIMLEEKQRFIQDAIDTNSKILKDLKDNLIQNLECLQNSLKP